MKERYEQEIEQLLAELESRPPDDTNAPPPAPASGAEHRGEQRSEHQAEQRAGQQADRRSDRRAGVAASPPADDLPSPFTPRPKPGLRLISPPKLALAGLVVAGVGLLPGFQMAIIAGLVIAGVAIAWMFLRRMMAPQTPAYWRGRPLEPSGGDAPRGVWARFRRWLAK